MSTSLGGSHRYNNCMVVITIWLTGTKYPYLKLQWIFYLLRRCCLSSVTAKTLPWRLYKWVTRWVSYKKQELLALRQHPWVFLLVGGRGVRVAHLFSFLCCPIMCLYVLSSVLWCSLRCWVRVCFQLLVGGRMSYCVVCLSLWIVLFYSPFGTL